MTPQQQLNLPKLNVPYVLSYLGGSVIYCLLTWLLFEQYKAHDPSSIFIISTICEVFFSGVGFYLWKKTKYQLLGGISACISLAMVPVIVFALQEMFGRHPGRFLSRYDSFYSLLKGGWFLMEIATFSLTAFTLYLVRFHLLAFILYVSMWFTCMDIVPVLLKSSSYNLSAIISIIFGFNLVALSYYIEQFRNKEFASWGYYIGLLSFCGGLTAYSFPFEFSYAIEVWIYVFLCLLASKILKREFLVFGVLGIISCLVKFYLFLYLDFIWHLQTPLPFLIPILTIILFIFIFVNRYKTRNKKTTAKSDTHRV